MNTIKILKSLFVFNILLLLLFLFHICMLFVGFY